MLVDIDKIVVGDRIRKDFGDIEELAEDIRENTLLNALVVTPSGNGDGTYTLIAGERRLKACKMLGYKAVTVNSVGVEDAERALMMEISENECRKEFTKTERLAYARQLARIEAAKSQQGQRNDLAQDVVQGERNRAANAVAKAVGTNRETLRQEQYIADNADLLEPADFADWDEGRLSTNKAYQRIKAAKEQAERDRAMAERELDATTDALSEAYRTNELMESEVTLLRKQVAERPKPEVVIPKDYEAIKRKVDSLEHDNRMFADTNEKLSRRLSETKSELDKAKDILGMDQNMRDVRSDVQYLVAATNQYVRRYGGLTWTFQQLREVDDATMEDLRIAVRNLGTFASTLMSNIGVTDGD